MPACWRRDDLKGVSPGWHCSDVTENRSIVARSVTERGSWRALTPGEKALASGVFRDVVDLSVPRIHRRTWWIFQTRNIVMAPDGDIYFHPDCRVWSEDFSREKVALRGLFIHEMTHVWQVQRGVILPLAGYPFCRYGYTPVRGKPLEAYGVEQQAQIVRHAFLLRQGVEVPGAATVDFYDAILPFWSGKKSE